VRVTDRLVFDTAILDTGRAREAAEQAQRVASRGTRIEHPGDDPAASGLIVSFNMSSQRFAAIAGAAGAASDELSTADGALDGVSTALSRARQLAVQFSNSTYSQAQRSGGALEVQGLMSQIVSDLNTRFGNRYVFGGTKDDAPPFSIELGSGAPPPDPAVVTYGGDDGVRQVEVAPNVFQQANVLVGSLSTDPNGVLATLGKLQAALQANDAPAVQATLDGLDAGINQVSTARAQVGVSMNTFDAATSAAKTASGDDKTRAGKLSDVDVIESSIKLQATQTALQASLAATAQGFRLSLVDFLK
jgi:flagellar hook-associated protein 3 FlgL